MRSRYTPWYLGEFAWDLLVDWWIYGGQYRCLILDFYWGTDLPKARDYGDN